MGLDMFLYAKRYLWESDERDNKLSREISDGLGIPRITDDTRVSEVKVNLAYWRKANAIHKWFVDHVQDNVDDCNAYIVSGDQLKQLYDITVAVCSDNDKAPELLPAQCGFFFGSTDYDEWYMQDVIYTRDALKMILNLDIVDDDSRYTIYYESSW